MCHEMKDEDLAVPTRSLRTLAACGCLWAPMRFLNLLSWDVPALEMEMSA